MHDSLKIRRAYVVYFCGTVLVWIAILLASMIILSGTPSFLVEMIVILAGGAISCVFGGAIWFLVFAHPADAHVAGPGDHVDLLPGDVRGRNAYMAYFVGSAVIWLIVLVATAIILRDTPYLLPDFLFVLCAGMLWFAVVVPLMLFRSRGPMPAPTE